MPRFITCVHAHTAFFSLEYNAGVAAAEGGTAGDITQEGPENSLTQHCACRGYKDNLLDPQQLSGRSASAKHSGVLPGRRQTQEFWEVLMEASTVYTRIK